MNQTVIFDLDGVIIDSEPIHFEIERQLFRDLDIDVPMEEHHGYVGTSSLNMWEMIVRKHEVLVDPGELTKRNSEIYLKYLNESELKPVAGVAELVEELYGNNLKLVVASSSSREVIETVLNRFRIMDFFMAVISGTELSNSKPHPDIFLKAAGLAGTEARRCVVIEDSENGVRAARAAGMKCIGFYNPNSGAQNLTGASIIVHSFQDLNTNRIQNLE